VVDESTYAAGVPSTQVPQNREDRIALVVTFGLILAEGAVVAGLCLWASSMYDPKKIGPFLLVMIPTCIGTTVCSLLFMKRLRAVNERAQHRDGTAQSS